MQGYQQYNGAVYSVSSTVFTSCLNLVKDFARWRDATQSILYRYNIQKSLKENSRRTIQQSRLCIRQTPYRLRLMIPTQKRKLKRRQDMSFRDFAFVVCKNGTFSITLQNVKTKFLANISHGNAFRRPRSLFKVQRRLYILFLCSFFFYAK